MHSVRMLRMNRFAWQFARGVRPSCHAENRVSAASSSSVLPRPPRATGFQDCRYASRMQPLDTVPWGDLEHAYGTAIDVPDWIRALAAGGPDAQRAADEVSASLHHQGSYYPATPVAVPYLIDALRQPTAARVEILDLLAGLGEADADEGYSEVRDSVAAVRSGHHVYLPLLGDSDPRVRAAAAQLIVLCPAAADGARADLLARVHIEPDPMVRANQVFALGRLGVPSHELAALGQDAAEVVRAAVAVERARLSPGTMDDLDSLVDAACLELDEAVWGTALGLLAAWAIGELARVRPADAETVLRNAIERRLAAGHRPLDHDAWLNGRPPTLAWQRHRILQALAGVLSALVFGDWATGNWLVTREELTEPQVEVLRWTVDYHLYVPVRAVPWSEPERMRRFLDAPDGPLERPLAVTRDGITKTRPTWLWLLNVDNNSPDGVREALVEQRTPQELVALARDAFSGAYTVQRMRPSPRVALLREVLAPHSSTVEDELIAWTRDLSDEPDDDEAAFVIVPLATLAQARGEVLDESYDPAVAASLGPEERDWLLESLPPERRTEVLARVRSGDALNRLLHLADPDEVARRIVSRLATQQPGDIGGEIRANNLLRALGATAAAPLRAALDQGDIRDPRLFADVLAELGGPTEHVVSVVTTPDGLVLRLSTPDGAHLAEVRAPRHPKHDDLAPLVAALPTPDEIRLSLQTEPALDHSTVYRLQRLFREFQVRSVRAGGSTLHARPGGSRLSYGSG